MLTLVHRHLSRAVPAAGADRYCDRRTLNAWKPSSHNPLFIPLVTIVSHRAVPAGGRLHRAGRAQSAGRFPGAPRPHARGPARPAAAARRRAEAAAQGRHHPHRLGQGIFWFAPVISTFTALTAFSVLPFTKYIYVADVNVGMLVILAMSAVGILGIILGGWSSNSHYPLLGALRSAAQLVSYEVALSFALLSGVMVAGTLSMQGIVKAQQERGIWFVFDNYGFMIVPFVVYIIAGDRRNQPRAVRSARSRIRTGRRIPHRVQRLPLGALLPGRVRQHLRGVVGGGDAVLGRLAAPVPERRLARGPAQLRLPGAAVRRLGGLGCLLLVKTPARSS